MVLTFIGVLANIFTLGKDIFPLVALFLVSFTISTHSVLNEKLTKMLINTRDNSKELTTQLVEKKQSHAEKSRLRDISCHAERA